MANHIDPSCRVPEGQWHLGEFCFPIRVYYEDTDLGGMVYHGRYVSFFERIRSESVRGTAADVPDLLAVPKDLGGPLVYVVRDITLSYRQTATAGDLLWGYTRVERVRAAAIDVKQRLERDGVIIAEASLVVALIGADGRPKRWPDAVRRAWDDWQKAYSARGPASGSVKASGSGE